MKEKKATPSGGESLKTAQEVAEGELAVRLAPYVPPKILSVEPLETMAALCDPPVGGLGKTGPPFCAVLGS